MEGERFCARKYIAYLAFETLQMESAAQGAHKLPSQGLIALLANARRAGGLIMRPSIRAGSISHI